MWLDGSDWRRHLELLVLVGLVGLKRFSLLLILLQGGLVLRVLGVVLLGLLCKGGIVLLDFGLTRRVLLLVLLIRHLSLHVFLHQLMLLA